MNQKWLLRVVVACALVLALWLGWGSAQPPERVGDVPYVPTRPQVVDRMLELAEVDAEDLVFDLGSGDGRIVIRAAEHYGARGRGFEIDPLLVAESRAAAAAAGVADRVEIVAGDLFDAVLGEATAVTLYLLPTVNLTLRARLFAELAPGTPVVSQAFDMAEWLPDVYEVMPIEPPAELYRWVIPAAMGGVWDVEAGPDGDGAPELADAEVALRLLQRFQEVEGEVLFAGSSVPVLGAISGSRVSLATTRNHPQLGAFELLGSLVDGELQGTMSHGEAGAAVSFTAARRRENLQGVWDLGRASEPFVAQWSIRLSRAGARWTATRFNTDTGDLPPATVPLPGSLSTAPAAATGERRMTDFYDWGASISFVVGAGDGSARRVVYHGLVEGDRITGVADDGSDLVRWVGVRRESIP